MLAVGASSRLGLVVRSRAREAVVAVVGTVLVLLEHSILLVAGDGGVLVAVEPLIARVVVVGARVLVGVRGRGLPHVPEEREVSHRHHQLHGLGSGPLDVAIGQERRVAAPLVLGNFVVVPGVAAHDTAEERGMRVLGVDLELHLHDLLGCLPQKACAVLRPPLGARIVAAVEAAAVRSATAGATRTRRTAGATGPSGSAGVVGHALSILTVRARAAGVVASIRRAAAGTSGARASDVAAHTVLVEPVAADLRATGVTRGAGVVAIGRVRAVARRLGTGLHALVGVAVAVPIRIRAVGARRRVADASVPNPIRTAGLAARKVSTAARFLVARGTARVVAARTTGTCRTAASSTRPVVALSVLVVVLVRVERTTDEQRTENRNHQPNRTLRRLHEKSPCPVLGAKRISPPNAHHVHTGHFPCVDTMGIVAFPLLVPDVMNL